MIRLQMYPRRARTFTVALGSIDGLKIDSLLYVFESKINPLTNKIVGYQAEKVKAGVRVLNVKEHQALVQLAVDVGNPIKDNDVVVLQAKVYGQADKISVLKPEASVDEKSSPLSADLELDRIVALTRETGNESLLRAANLLAKKKQTASDDPKVQELSEELSGRLFKDVVRYLQGVKNTFPGRAHEYFAAARESFEALVELNPSLAGSAQGLSLKKYLAIEVGNIQEKSSANRDVRTIAGKLGMLYMEETLEPAQSHSKGRTISKDVMDSAIDSYEEAIRLSLKLRDFVPTDQKQQEWLALIREQQKK